MLCVCVCVCMDEHISVALSPRMAIFIFTYIHTHTYTQARNKYFMRATECFKRGDKAQAKSLGEEGRRLNALMKARHRAAGMCVCVYRNMCACACVSHYHGRQLLPPRIHHHLLLFLSLTHTHSPRHLRFPQPFRQADLQPRDH